jgi:hypothetical protein
MNDVRWSESELRKYIDAEANLHWFDDQSERTSERARFRSEVRAVLVPVVQAALLERVGTVTDPEGLTMVCADLIDDLNYRHAVRRWTLVCADPWKYLAEWLVSEIERTYKVTAGRKRPSGKTLKEIERASQ